MIDIKNEKKSKTVKYLSLTLEQGSIISSFAAIRATQPSTIPLGYCLLTTQNRELIRKIEI
jgi:hypothetical protein